MMTDRDSSVAGTDNRPPMLEEDDFESWKIRMERYIRGKPNGKYMWKAIQTSNSPRPQVAGILSQGLPSLELLMKGSGKTLERRKEDMFDAYERFRANGNESIQSYFIRFHKLVNDMKVTQIDLPKHQLNTKFVNNLPTYWSKYVTHTKNVMNMSTDNYVDIFTHPRTYEPHALKSLKKLEQSSS
nr:hypothetical protein [Tanacetum cinerariifolium]